jgi:signal transduction histidine kinase
LITRRPPSTRLLALLLSLPLVLLAAAGVWVVRAERARVEAEWRAEAERRRDGLLAELPVEVMPHIHDPAASVLQNQLADRGYTIARWLIRGMDPPPTGRGWQAYEQLQNLIREGRREEARNAVEAPDLSLPPGIGMDEYSPSGTPLLLLISCAQLELAEPDMKTYHARGLVNTAVGFPSTLTGRIVQNALVHLPEEERSEWELKAQEAERVLAGAEDIARQLRVIGRLPSVLETYDNVRVSPTPGEWTAIGLVRHSDSRSVQVIPYDDLHDLMQPLVQRFSAATGSLAFTPQIAWYNGVIHASRGVELATGTKGAWRVWIFAPSPAALEAAVAERIGFLTWVFAGMLLVVAAAMWLTFRAFRKQAELARLQSEFVASVSHELRTPVSSIGVLAERLEEGKADAEQTTQYHRFIAREGRRLAALVDNVLDFSRIESGRKAYDFEHTDVPRLVRETAALMRPHAEEKGLTLTEEIHEVPEHLWPPVDAVAVRQALVNLIDNAIKFTPAGGEVTVKFGALDRDVLIHVRDTGIGIPPAERAKIFERFYRVDNGLRRETTGAGIGLSLVRHVAEAHGAKISVASEAGRGSVFTLRFPSAIPGPNGTDAVTMHRRSDKS